MNAACSVVAKKRGVLARNDKSSIINPLNKKCYEKNYNESNFPVLIYALCHYGRIGYHY